MRTLAVSLLLSLALHMDAEACSCMGVVGSLDAQMEFALGGFEAVFVGYAEKVTYRKETTLGSVPTNHQVVKFRVEKAWKLPNQNATEVETSTFVGCCACGFSMAEKSRYLVFANRVDSNFIVTTCSPTALLSEAKEKVRALNEIEKRSKG